ncbi:MAG: hypothetical protein ACLFNK_01890 [Candidatus Woesearchaeota archaeon]
MYLDEHNFIDDAKELTILGRNDLAKGIGWPLILNKAILLNGMDMTFLFRIPILFGSLATFIVFMITYLLTKKELFSLIASLISITHLSNIYWSVSLETNIASYFFFYLCILSYIIYFKNPGIKLFLFSIVLTGFTSLIRPENHILFFFFFLGILLFNKETIRNKMTSKAIFTILIVLLIIPNFILFLEFYTNIYQKDNNEGIYLDNLKYNTKEYAINIINDNWQPLLIFPFFILGFIFYIKKDPKITIYFFTIILMLYLIYFSYGLEETGAPHRYYFVFYPIFSFFITSFFIDLKKLNYKIIKNFHLFTMLIFILIIFIDFGGSYYEMYNDQRPNHRMNAYMPQRIEESLPDNSIIITHEPILFTTTELELVSNMDELKNIKNLKDRSLFYYNKTNFEKSIKDDLKIEVREKFDFEEVSVNLTRKDIHYKETLYRLTEKDRITSP